MRMMAVFVVALAVLSAGAAQQTLEKNTVWANDTTYVADRKVYEFQPSDREPVDCPPTHVKGHHFPRRTAFYLKSLRNVTLDFRGAEVFLHGKYQPFLLVDCTNVTVKNVSVRYDRTPYTQGVIRGWSDRELRVWIDPTNFPCRVENGCMVYASEHWTNRASPNAPCFCQFFDGTTRKGAGISLAFFAKNAVVDPAIPWAPGAIQFTPSFEDGLFVLRSDRSLSPWKGGMKPGNYVVVGHCARDHSNFELADCRDVTIRNYRIVNGLGMGIFPFHCHNVTLDGVKMQWDRTSPSVIANSADGIHAFSCSGDFIVTNCVVEGTIDDALNVHSNFYTVDEAKRDEIVAFTGLEPEGPTAIFRPGDRIAVHRGYTLDRTGEYTITAMRPIDEKHVAFTLDRPVGRHAKKDIIENLSSQCRLLISNSRFAKSNTHLRLQTRGGIVIENCETELPFCLTGDMDYWFESSPCDTLVVRNTKFVGPHARISSEPHFTRTKEHPHYHGDLVVENCTFDNGTPISANNAKSVTVKNCRTTSGGRIRIDRGNCAQVVTDVVDVFDEIRSRLAKGERRIALAKHEWTCDVPAGSAAGLSLQGEKDVELDFGGGTLRVPANTRVLELTGCVNVGVKNLAIHVERSDAKRGGADVVVAEGCDGCILGNVSVLAPASGRAFVAKACNGLRLEGCTARGTRGACMDLAGEDLVVEKCRVGDNEGIGIQLVARRATLAGNTFEKIRCAEVNVVTPVTGKGGIVLRENVLVGAGERWLRVNGSAFVDRPSPGVVLVDNVRR